MLPRARTAVDLRNPMQEGPCTCLSTLYLAPEAALHARCPEPPEESVAVDALPHDGQLVLALDGGIRRRGVFHACTSIEP